MEHQQNFFSHQFIGIKKITIIGKTFETICNNKINHYFRRSKLRDVYT